MFVDLLRCELEALCDKSGVQTMMRPCTFLSMP